MKNFVGVVITDGINRKNHCIPIETMINAYKKSADIPMMMNVGHDRTKPIGYALLDGIYLEPGKAYLRNKSFIVESDEDYKLLNQISQKADDRIFREEHVDELKELYNHLGSMKSENVKIAPTGQAVAVIDKGIVYRIFPELLEKQSEGLINLEELEPIYSRADSADEADAVLIPGIYKRDNYIIFAHRYMRRNLSYANTINDAFFVEIEKLRTRDALNIKIAIDPDMIGLLGSESYEVEYQYWWGPKFNDNLSVIPVGVTCHKNQNHEVFFTNISETQFYWHIQDQKKTFECEEICDRENDIINDQMMFGCRYVHSMLGKDENSPYHLDGAVRFYSDSQMIKRLEPDNDISKCGKDSVYYKLWRIDGNLDVVDWKEIITHFYRDNILVGEYFGGVDAKFEQIKSEDSDKVIAKSSNKGKYIPVNMSVGDGVRIYYKSIPKENLQECRCAKLINHSFIQMLNGDVRKYIEADAATFLKLLRKKGINLRIPYSAMIDFGDMVFNFPIVYCRDCKTAEIVLSAISDLCLAWAEEKDDRLLSFGIAIEEQGDKATQISFAGHIVDLLKLFENCNLKEFDSIDDWIVELYKKVSTYESLENIPDRSSLISDGRLWFGRRFAEERQVEKYKIDEKSLGVKIKVPIGDMTHLVNNKIMLAPVYNIRKGVCDKCGDDYLNCSCIKFIDKDVSEHIVEADYVGMIWTTRNCYYPDERLEIVKVPDL